MKTIEQYTSAVNKLTPQGSTWPSISDDSEIGKLWESIAQSLLSADQNASDMLNESYPDIVGAFLDDWSRVLGFPRCNIEVTSPQVQRDANLAWLNISPYSNKQFFVDIAAVLGYTITVEDKNDDLTLGAFEFRVTSAAAGIDVYFKTDASRCGEALLQTANNEPLECLINFFAPAHTTPIFVYV